MPYLVGVTPFKIKIVVLNQPHPIKIGNQCFIKYRYYAIFLRGHNYNDYLKLEVGLIPLSILIKVPLEKRKEFFQQCVDKINKECNGKLRDDLLAITSLLADLEWNSPDWITSSIDNSTLKEARMILELIRDAEKKTAKDAMEKGREEGRLEEAKEMALKALNKRFDEINSDLEKKIESTGIKTF